MKEFENLSYVNAEAQDPLAAKKVTLASVVKPN